MISDLRIEKLRQEYTNQYVVVEGDRPEYRRFQGRIGQVKTITTNARALVQFNDSADRAWYDLDLDYLKIVDRPLEQDLAPEGQSLAKTALVSGQEPFRLHRPEGKLSSQPSSE